MPALGWRKERLVLDENKMVEYKTLYSEISSLAASPIPQLVRWKHMAFRVAVSVELNTG